MAKVSKSKVVWAINETQSMRQASQLLDIAYNTFKKYAKIHDLWVPNIAGGPGSRKLAKGLPGGFKPPELTEILSGNNPNYSTAKLQYRLVREGFIAEEGSNCGYDEYRPADMSKPLQLDYLDDDSTNKELSNLRLLCFNCYYILKLYREEPAVPSNVKSFTAAINEAFKHSSSNESK